MPGIGASRREALRLGGAGLAAWALPAGAFAALETGKPLHGISAFGDLKYPAGFTHFDYASPDAPGGGTFNFSPPNWNFNQSVLTFNTLNSFALRGEAPPRMELCFDALMASALDEPDSLYGLLAENVTFSADRNTFSFKLRPQARFHDGSALTAEDVAFSYKLLKEKGHPDFQLPLLDMVDARAEDGTFHLVLNGTQSPRLILTLAVFPVMSKADIEKNGFEGGGLRPLLGSGPYKVGRVFAGQAIEYDRQADYWGLNLPVRRGLNHFARLRIEFYGDRQAAFEAFKKGEITYREEFTSRVWATGYDFPAIQEKRAVKREFPAEKRPSMQAWALNARRARFADRAVRQAVALCFDFEWTNRNLFYGLYERSQSAFEKSEFKAEGLPSPAELALLEPLRGKIPDEAFGEAVTQPVSSGSGRDRKLLTQASKLLGSAGWRREGGFFAKNGERLTLEILAEDDSLVRITGPFVENMRAVGIDASIRQVDSTQYEARQSDFDFDMVMFALSLDATPTRDSLDLFHSRSRDKPGSRNYSGTADPGMDADVAREVDGVERRRTDGRHTRARPRPAGAPRLDSELVCRQPPLGFLGHVRVQGVEAGLRLPRRAIVVAGQAESRIAWQGVT